MTSHMGHHLPSGDAEFERCMDALDADGLEVRPEERAAFATIHEFGLLPRILPVVHRAMDMGSLSPSAAADARRLVRDIREDGARPPAHRAVFMAAENHPQPERYWRLVDEGRGFHCENCHVTFGPFIDPKQSTDEATDHDHWCREVHRNA